MAGKRAKGWALLGIFFFAGGCATSATPLAATKAVAQANADQRFSFLRAPSERELLAKRLMAAMDGGNNKVLYTYADSEEKQLLHLTESSLGSLESLYLEEKTQFKALGDAECRPVGRSGAVCSETLRSSDTDVPVEAVVNETQDGQPRALVTLNLINAIIQMRSANAGHGNNTEAVLTKAQIDTYKYLRTKLAGKILGVAFSNWETGRLELASWDTVIRRSEERMNEMGRIPRLPMR